MSKGSESGQRALRVLLISPTGASEDRYGGAGTSMTRLLRFASPGEVEVTLLHGVAGHPYVPQFAAQARCGRVPFSQKLTDRLLFLRGGRKWIRHHARGFDVAFCISSMYSSLALGRESMLQGVPLVARIENSTRGLPPRGWYARFRDIDAERYRMLGQANAVVAMSALVENELRDGGIEPERIARIPQHCDTRRFEPRSVAERSEWRRDLGWPDRFTFLCVGEVVPRKRQHLLVESLATLVRAGHDVQLAIVGPIPDLAYGRMLTGLIEQQGLRDRVHFGGFTRQVQFMYFASDAFLLASLNENAPNSLIESMASGLPSIVSDFAGATDCIEEGVSGFVVPGGEGESGRWQEAMVRLATGDISHLGAHARRLAEQRHDSRLVWPRYLRVLRAAASEGSRA